MALNPRQIWLANRQWLTVLLLWVAWGACFQFGFLIQKNQYEHARKTLIPFHQQVESYSALIAQFPDVEKELQEYEARAGRLKERNLGREAVPKAVQQIAQIAAATGATLETIAPRDDFKGLGGKLPKGVGKRTLEVRLRCAYKSFGEFLEKMETLPARFVVEKASLRVEPQDSEGMIRVELFLSAYGLL